MSQVTRADQLYTSAACGYVKYCGLVNNRSGGALTASISEYASRMYENAKCTFEHANSIIAGFSEEELREFWSLQDRNRGAKRVEDLVTKREQFKGRHTALRA